MLVKFKNDSVEFENKVDALKQLFNVGAASKVAEACVTDYMALKLRFEALLDENNTLSDCLLGVQESIYQQKVADTTIKNLLAKAKNAQHGAQR
jgi:hypothetical protein